MDPANLMVVAVVFNASIGLSNVVSIEPGVAETEGQNIPVPPLYKSLISLTDNDLNIYERDGNEYWNNYFFANHGIFANL